MLQKRLGSKGSPFFPRYFILFLCCPPAELLCLPDEAKHYVMRHTNTEKKNEKAMFELFTNDTGLQVLYEYCYILRAACYQHSMINAIYITPGL